MNMRSILIQVRHPAIHGACGSSATAPVCQGRAFDRVSLTRNDREMGKK